MNQLVSTLLAIHVASGVLALAAAVVSCVSKWLDLPHRTHVISGSAFVIGMSSIVITAIVLSLIRPNAFLLLTALLSTYLTFSGWRYARNRSGQSSRIDWALVGFGLLTALGMAAWSAMADSNLRIVGMTFGGLLTFLVLLDLRILRGGGVRGTLRIIRHLTLMIGATIAATTAFTVNTIRGVEPGWLLWLAPTVLMVPIIVVWVRKVRGGHRVAGM